jgi:predicted RNA-binding protein YlxR (DUF448 family)
MVRCVLGAQGPAVGRTLPGRGAWLCSLACFDTAVRRKGFQRAWRSEVDPAALMELRMAFADSAARMREPIGLPVARKG